MRELSEEFPASNAENLGLYLNLPHARIQKFSHDNPRNCRKMMQDVLCYWLENDKDKSWLKLADAVQDCGYQVLAVKIRSKYGASQTKSAS